MKRPKCKKDKKGGMLDLLYVGLILFALVLIIFFVHKVWAEMSPEIMASELGNTTEGQAAIIQTTSMLNGFNELIPLLFFLLIFVIVMLAYFTDVHPVFLFIAFLLLIVFIAVATMLSNAFEEVTAAGDFSNETDTYTAPVFLIQKLPYLLGVAGIMVMIAIYAKWKLAGG